MATTTMNGNSIQVPGDQGAPQRPETHEKRGRRYTLGRYHLIGKFAARSVSAAILCHKQTHTATKAPFSPERSTSKSFGSALMMRGRTFPQPWLLYTALGNSRSVESKDTQQCFPRGRHQFYSEPSSRNNYSHHE